ncbi:thiaminase II [Arthrobacter echini]|uniref:Thiaminase II n=1 Tax=Arthrobacter echini TaxID=1529066 RepID=A0A5D0XVC0_9MICC|nr:TenA family protein [Arthrobacter echini]TYD00609.1 thiaminase II [Arthrobacter echini]
MSSLHTMAETIIRAGEDPAVFSAVAWHRTAGVREAIDALPFLRQLADATLPEEIFSHYLAQDALYLAEYGRVLAAAAAQAQSSQEMVFWARSTREVIDVERQLHANHIGDLAVVEPSPTTVAYTSYLLSLAASGSYPVLAAGLLPCFWIYDDIGSRLRAVAGDLGTHPYGDWIGAYDDPDFTAATDTARTIVDHLAGLADPSTVTRMHAAFHRATQYEWMFWDAAYRQETWPV